MAVDEYLLYSYIGTRLRERRRALGRTQQWLADRLAVERTSVSNIEAGTQRVPLHVLYRCCNALDLEITDLVPQRAVVLNPGTATIPDTGIQFDGRTVLVPPKTASFVQSMQRRLGEEKNGRS